jgi:acetyl esterase/lipase
VRLPSVGVSRVPVLILLGMAGALGCAQAETSAGSSEPAGTLAPLQREEFATTSDRLDASIVTPPDAATDEPPLIVLVPGGGWVSADPSGLVPLADSMARDGAVVVNLTYRTSVDGVYFPKPVSDVACGVASAVAEATRRVGQPSEVTVVGHSAGAQMAALVALAPDEFADPGCSAPAVAPDRLVGLAGPYDVTRAADAAANLFGPDLPDPRDWTAGNPVALAGQRREVPVLLVHGAADRVVPTSFTEQFAAALDSGGHEVTTQYPAGVDHATVYSAEVAEPIIAEWLGLGGR